jgi:DNA-binding transcriptional LysR family regulator
MLIDLVQIRTFVAVAEELHLTRAAERLHISPSSASTHIRAVEKRFDIQLFVRSNRSLELTGAGQVLLRQAKTLLGEAAQLGSVARQLRGQVDGDLVISANSEPLNSRIGEVIASLRERYPLVRVDLRARHSAGSLQGLKTGEIDVGILSDGQTDASLTYHALTAIRFRIAGPVAWREQIERADWAELASLPWITSADRSLTYSSWLTQLFADKGLELNTVVRFDNGALARALLPGGVGMLLLREEHALQGVRDGYLAISPLAVAEFPLRIAHLTSRSMDPLIQAFIEVARSVWPGMAEAPAPSGGASLAGPPA